MKNIIKYYYNLNSLKSYNNKINEFITDNNEIYILEIIYDINKIYNIYNKIKNHPDFYKILKNINNDIVTVINGNKHILIKKNKNKLKKLEPFINMKIDGNVNKPNWTVFWENKIDYYEYHYQYIIDKHKVIDESINYYIGLGECAIQYLKYNNINFNEDLVLSHNRINEDNYYNPANLTIDYRPRDIAEYLKYLFYEGKYKEIDLYSILKKIHLTKNEYIMLYARMIFPTRYFDYYDQVINEKVDEMELLKIINKKEEYEMYLKKIYNIINKISIIPKIDWL